MIPAACPCPSDLQVPACASAYPGVSSYEAGFFALLTTSSERSIAAFRVLERYRTTVEVTNLAHFERLATRKSKCTGIIVYSSPTTDSEFQNLNSGLMGRDVPVCSLNAATAGFADHLTAFIRWALARESCVNTILAPLVCRFAEAHGLTPRETELLGATVGGVGRMDLATELGVSVNTLKYQARAVIRKAHATSVEEVALRILRASHNYCTRCGESTSSTDSLLDPPAGSLDGLGADYPVLRGSVARSGAKAS